MIESIADGCIRVVAFCLRMLPDLIRDAAGLAAVGSISYGAWLIYEPAGFIVGGILVLAGVIVSSKRGG